MKYVVEPGEFEIMVGNSSRDSDLQKVILTVRSKPVNMAEHTSTRNFRSSKRRATARGDAAANFVFMTMILFQANFYTDVFGLSAGLAATLLLVSRLWDAFFDPIMGVLADRTQTRWGQFRPWVLWTSVPWAVVMVLAYTTPHFGSTAENRLCRS